MSMSVSYLGRPVVVETAAEAAQWRLTEIRAQAHDRAAVLVPGGVWTSGLSVVLVALSQQPVGTMTVARAQEIIAGAQAIWSALLAAETDIETALADTGLSEAEKIALIDATWPTWPAAPEA